MKELYEQLAEKFKAKYGESHGLFTTHKGKNTDENAVLYVGLDTNGQGKNNSLDNYKPFYGFIEGDLEWLKLDGGYPYTGSPFWRVVGQSYRDFSGQPYNREIFEKIYWSNIYKVAPITKKKNTYSMRQRQTELNKDLLFEEVKTIQPKAVVFLTGNWIEDFLDFWKKEGRIINLKNNTNVKYYCKTFSFNLEDDPVKAIVLKHPQNTQSDGSEEDLFQHIAEYLK